MNFGGLRVLEDSEQWWLVIAYESHKPYIFYFLIILLHHSPSSSFFFYYPQKRKLSDMHSYDRYTHIHIPSMVLCWKL